MNAYELLKELIDRVHNYEEAVDDKDSLTLHGFAQHIESEFDLEDLKSLSVKNEGDNVFKGPPYIADNLERIITQHLLFLYRYVRFYAKFALAGRSIRTLEEFGVMMMLMQDGKLSKSELIRKNVIEKSSGVEIINRLVKSGLVAQEDNPDDQRGQLVVLTDAGRQELFGVFAQMDMLGVIAAGDLHQGEKITLARMLKKLDQFHFGNYNNRKLGRLEDFLPEGNGGSVHGREE